MSNNSVRLFNESLRVREKNKRMIIVCWYESDMTRQNCITAAHRCFEERGYTVIQYGLLRAKNEKKDYIFTFDLLINSFNPSIILFWNWNSISYDELAMIKMNHSDRVFMVFNWDDPHCWLKPMPKLKFFDISLSTCSSTLNNYTNLGVSLSKYLLPGFSPSIHYHELDTSYACDVSFMCTNLYKNGAHDRDDNILVDRFSMVQALDNDSRFHFRLYGPHHLRLSVKKSYHSEVPYEKNRLVFSNSKININVHGAYGEGYLNERTFTILGSGGLMLIDNIPGLDRILTPNVNCVVIEDTDPIKMCDQINNILINYDKYYAIRMAGLELANKFFTYDVWADTILNAYSEYMCSPKSVGKYCSYFNTLNNVIDNQYVSISDSTNKSTPLVMGILIDFSDKDILPIDLLHFRDKIHVESPNSTIGWAIKTNLKNTTSESLIANIFGLVKYFIDRYGDSMGLGFGFMNHNLPMSFMKHYVKHLDAKYTRYINLGDHTFNNYNSVTNMNELIEVSYFKNIPIKYRPKFIMSYSINQEQVDWINENLDIKIFMCWTATQTNVDGFSGDGTILSPYYMHKQNPMIPAQTMEDSNGCLIFNTMTIDPIGCRYTKGESRWTLHPADPLTDGAQQILLIKRYLTNPLKSFNTINYLSIFVDANWVFTNAKLKPVWESIIQFVLQPHTNIVLNSPNVFGCDFVSQHKNNDNIDFMLDFRGTNISKAGNSSLFATRFVWAESKTQRIIFDVKRTSLLSNECNDGSEEHNEYKVIDFTDYTKPVKKLEINASTNYITGRNFKLFPDEVLTDDEKIRAGIVFGAILARSNSLIVDSSNASLIF